MGDATKKKSGAALESNLRGSRAWDHGLEVGFCLKVAFVLKMTQVLFISVHWLLSPGEQWL